MRHSIPLDALPIEVQAKFRREPKRRNAEPSRVAQFLKLLASEGLPQPAREYRFDSTRRWRFDLAWPAWNLACEIDGGIWTRGRHTRGAGWLKDTEKLNAAAVAGWRMLRCAPNQLCTDDFLATLRAALAYHTP